jgi:hypothetical protein
VLLFVLLVVPLRSFVAAFTTDLLVPILVTFLLSYEGISGTARY